MKALDKTKSKETFVNKDGRLVYVLFNDEHEVAGLDTLSGKPFFAPKQKTKK